MKLSIKTIIKILILFSLIVLSYSQEKEDSTQTVQQESLDNFKMTKSPWGAVLRSAILPGLGQAYNESYWKIPIIWGFLGFYTYKWIEYDKEYQKYKSLNNIRFRNYYHDLRDSYSIYFAIAYLLNVVDAYVGAHLFDFDVSENVYTKSPQLNMRINLK